MRTLLTPLLLLALLGPAGPAPAQGAGSRPDAACAWLGFTYDLSWNARGEVLDGLLVREVAQGGAAARAGLAPGDVVVAVDGAALTVPYLAVLAQRTRAGDAVRLKVLRHGRELALTARAQAPPGRCRAVR
jgi:S1-C subfamily serine protease